MKITFFDRRLLMGYKLALIISTLLLFVSCDSSKFTESPSGLQYKFLKKGDGQKPDDGNIVLINVSYTDAQGRVLYDSKEEPGPRAMAYDATQLNRAGGLEESIKMLGVGDSAVFKFPIEDLFEQTFQVTLPDTLERGTLVAVAIGMSDAMTMEEYQQYFSEIRAKEEIQARADAVVQFDKDVELIDDYLIKQGIEVQIHDSGLRYQILEEGAGPIPKVGEQVHVNYEGRFLNGTLFDTSIKSVAQAEGVYNPAREYKPYSFPLGRRQVIQGWEIGFGLLKQGSKARFYIPSKLGYGPVDDPEIPAHSILVFEVELLSIGE